MCSKVFITIFKQWILWSRYETRCTFIIYTSQNLRFLAAHESCVVNFTIRIRSWSAKEGKLRDAAVFQENVINKRLDSIQCHTLLKPNLKLLCIVFHKFAILGSVRGLISCWKAEGCQLNGQYKIASYPRFFYLCYISCNWIFRRIYVAEPFIDAKSDNW